jgi:trans-aconitate methyltransferase
MLPDLTGKSVIDLGCGYGWFCRAARELGASDVTGVDISEKMLARAAELTADPQIHYQRSDLESLSSSTITASIWSTARWHCTTCRNWIRYSPTFSARLSPAAAWSFRWSTPFTPAPPVRAG